MTISNLDPNIQAVMTAAQQAIASAQQVSASAEQLLSKLQGGHEAVEKKAQSNDQILSDEVTKIVQTMDEDTLQFLQESA